MNQKLVNGISWQRFKVLSMWNYECKNVQNFLHDLYEEENHKMSAFETNSFLVISGIFKNNKNLFKNNI